MHLSGSPEDVFAVMVELCGSNADLLRAKQALSQLSYSPMLNFKASQICRPEWT